VRADDVKGKGESVVIINGKELIQKVEFIGWWCSERLVTEKVSNDIVGTAEVYNLQAIFLNNQPPVVDTISCKIQKGEILVIGVDADDMPSQDGAIFLQGFHNGKELQFDDGVVGLGVRKFAAIESERTILLLNHGSICLADASV
jgi:hypothetical protein